MEINTEGRFMDDRASLEALIEQLSPDIRALYKSYSARSMEACFPNRKLVVYTLEKGAPADIEVLSVGNMEMSPFDGPVVTLSDSAGEQSVGVHPLRWRDRDVFFHVPQTFEFKWKGKPAGSKRVQFAPHFAVLVKTRSREHTQTEGDTYAVTLNKFRERFPEVSIRY